MKARVWAGLFVVLVVIVGVLLLRDDPHPTTVQVGQTYDTVTAILGSPDGRARNGDTEVLTYPTFTVVLVNNRVVSINAF